MPKLISKRQAAELVHYHPEHMMRLSRAGKFPRAIKIGDGPNAHIRFVEAEIEQWLADKLAARDSESSGVAA